MSWVGYFIVIFIFEKVRYFSLLFLPRRLFKVFHIGLILNLFASISEVMYDFLEVRNKLFSRFLNLVYLILFSEVGLVMYFYIIYL